MRPQGLAVVIKWINDQILKKLSLRNSGYGQKKMLHPLLNEITIYNSKFFHFISYYIISPLSLCFWTIPTTMTITTKIAVKQIRFDMVLMQQC